MARSRLKCKGRAEGGGFIALPHALYDSPAFTSLSGTEHKVLLGLMRQYRGKNNGNLSASHTQAKVWGVGSKTSLAKALDRLQQLDLIIRTREGVFLNPGGRCALYALTWLRIDDCPGKDLEVNPTVTPLLKLSMLKSRMPGPVSVPG
ncbi:hypothetical protein [Pseudomonas tumuqii]|uniref:hypothetical protein n=1 Tax=Pseudomonas tumuqii TaxID=2715755 RepID=UPI0015523676|nr:hypothetical protein [Pseudomonas tumuqii]